MGLLFFIASILSILSFPCNPLVIFKVIKPLDIKVLWYMGWIVWAAGMTLIGFAYYYIYIRKAKVLIKYGIYKLIHSDYHLPLNMGRDRMVSVNELADIVADIAGVEISKKHIEGPEGVRGRNSDNTRCKEVLGWAPETSLEEGFAKTYPWIEEQLKLQVDDLDLNLEDFSHSKVIN